MKRTKTSLVNCAAVTLAVVPLDHNEYWIDGHVSDEVLRRLGYAVARPLARRRMGPARIVSRGAVRAVLTARKLRSRRV